MFSLVRIKTTARRQRVRRQSAKPDFLVMPYHEWKSAIATKWRKHLAVGREPTVEFSDHSLALKGRQRVAQAENWFRLKRLLSPLRG
jgi:hypothetical protein